VPSTRVVPPKGSVWEVSWGRELASRRAIAEASELSLRCLSAVSRLDLGWVSPKRVSIPSPISTTTTARLRSKRDVGAFSRAEQTRSSERTAPSLASSRGCVAGLASNNRSSARGGAYVVDGGGEVLGPVGGVRRLLLAHHVARHRRDPRAARPARPAATRVTSQADLVRVGRLAGHSSGNLG